MRPDRRGEPAEGRWALFLFHLLRSELGPARELAAELVALGSEPNDPALLSAGHWQVGTLALYQGDLQEAQHNLERALTITPCPAVSIIACCSCRARDVTGSCQSSVETRP